MIATIVVMGLISAVSILSALVSVWLMPVCFLALTTLFVRNALRKIPAEKPISKAILVFLGERQKIVLKEGWNFVPLYPFVFDFILIKVEKVVQELPEHIVRTPDLAEIGAKISMAWIPGIKNTEGITYEESLINYLNTGGEDGVRKNLSDMTEDRLRTWAISNQEGPSDWVEAMASKDEALEVLLKAILGDSLPKVDSDIPTTAWMKYFSRPRRKPSLNEIRMGWAVKDPADQSQLWAGLQAEFAKLSPEAQGVLESQVGKRAEAVRKIKEGIQNIEDGQGMFSQKALGITILRFTVNAISLKGKTAEKAESDAKEKQEAKGEAREIKNVSRRIRKLRQNNPEMSLEEAIRIVQIQQGKISESVIRVLGASTGLGQDFLGALGFQKLPGEKPASDPSEKKGGKAPEDMTPEELDEYFDGLKAKKKRD
jgi:hypothetical protein